MSDISEKHLAAAREWINKVSDQIETKSHEWNRLTRWEAKERVRRLIEDAYLKHLPAHAEGQGERQEAYEAGYLAHKKEAAAAAKLDREYATWRKGVGNK